MLPRRHWPSPPLQQLGNYSVPLPDFVGSVSKLHTAFANCYGPAVLLALLRQDFYYRAFMDGVTPFTYVGYN
ncbi:MAG TPA: hypothetical protein VF020_11425 [Chthoniobacterales bacterium]